MQLLIFLGHSGTSCTLYNVFLKTLVVNRCHNIAQMQERRRRRRGRGHNGTGCDLYLAFFFWDSWWETTIKGSKGNRKLWHPGERQIGNSTRFPLCIYEPRWTWIKMPQTEHPQMLGKLSMMQWPIILISSLTLTPLGEEVSSMWLCLLLCKMEASCRVLWDLTDEKHSLNTSCCLIPDTCFLKQLSERLQALPKAL